MAPRQGTLVRSAFSTFCSLFKLFIFKFFIINLMQTMLFVIWQRVSLHYNSKTAPNVRTLISTHRTPRTLSQLQGKNDHQLGRPSAHSCQITPPKLMITGSYWKQVEYGHDEDDMDENGVKTGHRPATSSLKIIIKDFTIRPSTAKGTMTIRQQLYNSKWRITAWTLLLMWSSWWTKSLDGVGGP